MIRRLVRIRTVTGIETKLEIYFKNKSIVYLKTKISSWLRRILMLFVCVRMCVVWMCLFYTLYYKSLWPYDPLLWTYSSLCILVEKLMASYDSPLSKVRCPSLFCSFCLFVGSLLVTGHSFEISRCFPREGRNLTHD